MFMFSKKFLILFLAVITLNVYAANNEALQNYIRTGDVRFKLQHVNSLSNSEFATLAGTWFLVDGATRGFYASCGLLATLSLVKNKNVTISEPALYVIAGSLGLLGMSAYQWRKFNLTIINPSLRYHITQNSMTQDEELRFDSDNQNRWYEGSVKAALCTLASYGIYKLGKD